MSYFHCHQSPCKAMHTLGGYSRHIAVKEAPLLFLKGCSSAIIHLSEAAKRLRSLAHSMNGMRTSHRYSQGSLWLPLHPVLGHP